MGSLPGAALVGLVGFQESSVGWPGTRWQGGDLTEITSRDITAGDPIDSRFTCEGQDLSPQLGWGGVPEGTEELVVICEDPDAPGGTFIHWVLAGLSPSSTGLERGTVPEDAVQGVNDFGRQGYGGPCPPPGHGPHRYFFRLFALSSKSGIKPGATASAARAAMQGSTLAESSLMGTYERA